MWACLQEEANLYKVDSLIYWPSLVASITTYWDKRYVSEQHQWAVEKISKVYEMSGTYHDHRIHHYNRHRLFMWLNRREACVRIEDKGVNGMVTDPRSQIRHPLTNF